MVGGFVIVRAISSTFPTYIGHIGIIFSVFVRLKTRPDSKVLMTCLLLRLFDITKLNYGGEFDYLI